MEIRSPLLSSKIARDGIGEKLAADLDFSHALAAIDKMGSLYDAMSAAQKSVSPHETIEARAMRYEKQFNQAKAKAQAVLEDAYSRLQTRMETIRAAGLFQSGLSSPPEGEQEIRAALRGMNQKDRDKALTDAFERGDVQVLASIRGANPVTWGGSTLPLDQQFDAFIDEVTPELVAQRKAIRDTVQALELATDAFLDAAGKWHDPLAAERGRQQQEEYERADAALKAQLEG